MKAVRLVQPGRPLELHEIPVPEVGPNDVLVRVKAAGICHSDAHYRAGKSRAMPLPLTLGHEVAGLVEEVGSNVSSFCAGDLVCVHYLATCGQCECCRNGDEQFCVEVQMIGNHRDGGYAEFLLMPARSAFKLPDEISLDHGAVMMCSSATSLHALRKARLKPGETVAVYGIGGLGASAIQLARALEAGRVLAVDINPDKLRLAEELGATPINAAGQEPVSQIRELTQGRGVDVALELIGLPVTMSQAVRSLANKGRAALAGISVESFSVAPYADLINREAEIIGVSDHLASELPSLLEFARTRKLNLTKVVTRTVPLDAEAINEVLDQLENFSGATRVVIHP